MLTEKYYAKIASFSQTYTTLFSHRRDRAHGSVFHGAAAADGKRTAAGGHRRYALRCQTRGTR